MLSIDRRTVPEADIKYIIGNGNNHLFYSQSLPERPRPNGEMCKTRALGRKGPIEDNPDVGVGAVLLWKVTPCIVALSCAEYLTTETLSISSN